MNDFLKKRITLKNINDKLKQKTLSLPFKNILWDDDQQSQFIESLVMNIPIPLFCVYENKDVVWQVVDGFQRINAINNFINGELKLVDIEFMNDIKGLTFSQLPKNLKKRILKTEFQFVIINPSAPKSFKDIIYRRFNC